MKKLFLILTVATLFSVLSAQASDNQAAFDLIQDRMGALSGLWTGTSREEYWDCGIEFTMNDGKFTALFFYPSDASGRDVRGVFQLSGETRVRKIDDKLGMIEVTNKYEVQGSRATTRKASISFEMNPNHTIHQVNIGWSEDNQFPIPTYGCVLDRSF